MPLVLVRPPGVTTAPSLTPSSNSEPAAISSALLLDRLQRAPADAADDVIPVDAAQELVEFGRRHACRIAGSHQGAHARAGDAVDLDALFLEDLEHADVRAALGPTACQDEPDAWPLPFSAGDRGRVLRASRVRAPARAAVQAQAAATSRLRTGIGGIRHSSTRRSSKTTAVTGPLRADRADYDPARRIPRRFALRPGCVPGPGADVLPQRLARAAVERCQAGPGRGSISDVLI